VSDAENWATAATVCTLILCLTAIVIVSIYSDRRR
jgi:hypothetical protein